MRTTILIFAFLITASTTVSAEQSVLESIGTKAVEDAVGSSPPADVTEGANAAKETTSKAQSLKGATEDQSTATDNAVESAKNSVKKKAVDSVLEMVP